MHGHAEGGADEVEKAVVGDLQADTGVEGRGPVHLSALVKLAADQRHHLAQQKKGREGESVHDHIKGTFSSIIGISMMLKVEAAILAKGC